MKRSLLEYLCCPVSREPLHLRNEICSIGGEITSGELVANSGACYPITNGVPNLVVRQSLTLEQQKTIDSFSEKWRLAPNYRTATSTYYKQWYLDRYGFKDESALASFLSSKSFILDAGTGLGRDAELFAKLSPGQVFAIDISSGVDLAYRQLGDIANLHFLQADLRNPPFRTGFFDFISCDQVIHHTPNTRESLEALLDILGRGHLAFYVYKVKAPIREFCDDYLRNQTSNMTVDECLAFSEQMTALGKVLADLNVEFEMPVDIPLLGFKKGKQNLQRWIYWTMFKCFWNDEFDWNSNVIINFDWYHPVHAHRHTPEEVRSWLCELSLVVERFFVMESGISVISRRT